MSIVDEDEAQLRRELDAARAERDDWQRVATEAVRILLEHPALFAELRHVLDDLDLMQGSGPPAVLPSRAGSSVPEL